MPNIQLNTTQLKEYAQLAQASYANFTNKSSTDDVVRDLGRPFNKAAQFSATQAEQLTARYEIVDQYKGLPNQLLDDGFSATVMRDKSNPNHVVLSFRGTEPKGLQLVKDLIVSDAQIGIAGYAKPKAYLVFSWGTWLSNLS